ncbi:MAG: hypothetical protein ACI9TH_004470 [Kiritimatiellia bacterium]|jgi:hypothetical protein
MRIRKQWLQMGLQMGLTMGLTMGLFVPRLYADFINEISADNPTSWWRMDDASSPLADAVGGANAVVTGAPLFQEPGAGPGTGSSLRFDPADGGDFAQAANVIITTSFSVELWARSATSAWNEFGWLSSERGANGFLLHPESGLTSWRGFVVNNAGSFEQIGSHSPGVIDDAFHHYAITFDAPSTTGTMYFDGVQVAQNTGMTSVRDANANITIEMGRDDTGSRFGNGWLDEIVLYDHALSSDRVLTHFQSAAIPEPGSALLMIAGLGVLSLGRRR